MDDNSENNITKSAPQETTPPASGSWGSWLSSATTLVSSSVNQYILPRVSNLQQNVLNPIAETTSQLTTKVRELALEDPSDNSPTTATTTTTKDSKLEESGPRPVTMEEGPTVPEKENEFLSAVDKGFTVLENSVGLLGNYFNQGIAKVMETSTDIETLKTTAKELASVSLERAKSLGGQLASTSIDTLETVGKSAVKLLTVQETVPSSTTSQAHAETNATPESDANSEKKVEEIMNHNYFEDYQGAMYFQQLEKLSLESTIKIQKKESSLSQTQLQEVNGAIEKITNLFENSQPDTTVKAEFLSETFLQTFANVNNKFENIISSWKTELKASGNQVLHADIFQLTVLYCDKILLESVKTLSQYSALSLKEFYTIVQNSPSNVQELDLTVNRFLQAFHFTYNELSHFVEKFAAYFTVLLEESKSCLDTTQIEELSNKVLSHQNHIQLDVNNFLSILTECKHFGFIICKCNNLLL